MRSEMFVISFLLLLTLLCLDKQNWKLIEDKIRKFIARTLKAKNIDPAPIFAAAKALIA